MERKLLLGHAQQVRDEAGDGRRIVRRPAGSGQPNIGSDPARVRPGAARAAVEGRLLVSAEVAREVVEAGGDLDDDGTVLVLSRSVSAEGRSWAFAGGRSVPVSLLQLLADDLVAVHGQADQQQLLKPGRQRDALNRFADPELAAVLSDYRRVFARHRTVREELQALTLAARERAVEAETLRFGLAEVEAVAPALGEDGALLAEDERLSNADALHAAATTAHEALLGDPASAAVDGADAVTLLGAAGRALEAVRSHDPVLAGLADRLSEATYLVSDVTAELASYAESQDSDPARLAAVQERRTALGRLVRAYAPAAGDVAGVLDWAKQAASRLAAARVADRRGQRAGRARPPTGPTTWRSGWPRTRARRRCRCTRAHPAASCPGSCWPSRWCSPARTRCRRSCSTRSTPGWAARPRPRSGGGWPGWRARRR